MAPTYYPTRDQALSTLPDNNLQWVSVARDKDDEPYYKPKPGAKKFRVLQVTDWLKEVTVLNIHEYELLRGAVRLYVDLDWAHSQMGDRKLDPKDTVVRVLNTITTVLGEHGRTVEGIALCTASGPKGDDWKESFHAVFHTDKIFPSVQALKEFMTAFVFPRIPSDLYRADGVCIVDKVPYGSFQPFRFLGQSKRDSNRVLVPVHGWTANSRTTPYMFLIGDYMGWPTWEPPVPVSEHKEKQKRDAQPIVTPVYDTPPGYLVELCDLVPDAIMDENDTCFKFICAIWNTMPTPEGRDLIIRHYNRVPHKKSQSAEAYVDSVIQRAKSSITMGTLSYWAKEAHPKEYRALYTKYGMNKRDAMEITAPTTTIKTSRYSERYVQPFSFADTDTIILSSHLGTGKTTQTVKMIGEYTRVLIVSGRKTFSRFIMGDLADKGLPFVSYLDAGHGPLSAHSRLVIQVESLWRLEDRFQDYDFVILDESETILNQLFSETTNRHHMIQNHMMLERVVKGGRKVLYADAFISRRSLANAEMLRNPEHAHYIVNEFCPYERNALCLVALTQGDRQIAVPATAEFCKRIMDDLYNKKRVVVIWSSLKKGKSFVESFLKQSSFNYRFYSSESGPKEQKELENVSESWKSLDLLMMTTTITVGINYDPANVADMYDRIYLYGCAASALPRDIAQCLMRCRNLRDNQLIYTLDETVFEYPISGANAIRADLEAKRARLTTEHPLIQWTSVADRAYNYKRTLNNYLERSGYTISSENLINEKMSSEDCEEKFIDIKEIDDATAEDIKFRIKRDMATPEEKRQLYKHRFMSSLAPEHHSTADSIWSHWISFESPISSRELHDMKKEERAETLAWIQDMKKLTKERESKFWNIVNEKHQKIEDSLEFEASGRFAGMTSRKCNRRVLLQKVLTLFGMDNSCQGGSVVINDVIVAQMKEIESEVMSSFGEKSKSRRNQSEEFSQSNAIDLIKMVFDKWSDVDVKSESKKKQINKVRVNVYTLTLTTSGLWDKITPRQTGAWGED